MKIGEFYDEIGIEKFTDIKSIRYDDNNGSSCFCEDLLRVGIEIMNDEAIIINGICKFIGAFNFNKYKTYRDEKGVIFEDNKNRYIEVYFK